MIGLNYHLQNLKNRIAKDYVITWTMFSVPKILFMDETKFQTENCDVISFYFLEKNIIKLDF